MQACQLYELDTISNEYSGTLFSMPSGMMDVYCYSLIKWCKLEAILKPCEQSKMFQHLKGIQTATALPMIVSHLFLFQVTFWRTTVTRMI